MEEAKLADSLVLTDEASEVAQEGSLLDKLVAQGRFARTAESRERGKDLIKEFISQVLEGHMTVSRDAEAAIQERIAQIDRIISEQLNEILHHPSFQKLEGTWRGIRYLMDQSETNSMLKLKVLPVSKRELLRDLQRASEFDQSSLFKKVYEEEFGIFGGAPFAALIGDYEFSKSPEDMDLLQRVAQVAASAHAPFLSAASPDLLNLRDFTQLGLPRDIGKIFDTTEYAKWKSFRQSEDSRYVALTLPRVLTRLPYGKETQQIEGFDFEENVDGSDHSKYLWSNAAYALGARLTSAFARYGWCAAIRGVEGGGLVEDLPAHTFATDEGDIALKCPTEAQITDRREKELADQGLVPLVHCKGTDYAAFFSVQSVNKPRLYDKDAANANARLSAQMPYILAMSRFAHYLKAMMRDKIGSFTTVAECQKFLNNWISQYVLLDDTASQSAKARLPLREARIEVSEVPGKPGAFRAVAFLKPHFQLDELTISLRLVADLPDSARN
ncbi:type VI secretion system contractile sheath large subunit [Terriglobus saanensis]|uniref:Type VI secretion protein, EvpB/VC_A0108 family n=1 Tax=Terriglobus saanensis (strain ATCC BAA-1853 / DSM 23119 / SP1PR4) TaxID=401053 RepID=E8UX27_TERSS|nr:type VI secretion system contractile sheath large subunit [Terriglobus saanensis]ADV81914.1 type VI secretion protein, EvpB/VC_A0108 family [Terriglobus saanensis SP1PR4]